MTMTFLATMGERPAAITVALDALMARGYEYERVVLLVTDPNTSKIAAPLKKLRAVMQSDYPSLRVHEQKLTMHNDAPIIDIQTQTEANAYYDAMLDALHHYKQHAETLHLLVSGGRKAMSIYATLAAQLLFGANDKLWTVLSHPRLVETNAWHVPRGQQDTVQIVDMPLVPDLPQDVDRYDYMRNRRYSRRNAFLQQLSPRERDVVELVWSQPDLTVAQVAAQLGKGEKTVGNQFTSIYSKMTAIVGEVNHRRNALIRLLNEEE